MIRRHVRALCNFEFTLGRVTRSVFALVFPLDRPFVVSRTDSCPEYTTPRVATVVELIVNMRRVWTDGTMKPDELRGDFERFCTAAAVEMALSPQPKDHASDESSNNTVNDFAGLEYDNPIAWHRKYKKTSVRLTKDVLFDNVEMKYITLAQYGSDRPEYIKWKL